MSWLIHVAYHFPNMRVCTYPCKRYMNEIRGWFYATEARGVNVRAGTQFRGPKPLRGLGRPLARQITCFARLFPTLGLQLALKYVWQCEKNSCPFRLSWLRRLHAAKEDHYKTKPVRLGLGKQIFVAVPAGGHVFKTMFGPLGPRDFSWKNSRSVRAGKYFRFQKGT